MAETLTDKDPGSRQVWIGTRMLRTALGAVFGPKDSPVLDIDDRDGPVYVDRRAVAAMPPYYAKSFTRDELSLALDPNICETPHPSSVDQA